jgi:hypothetical protein
MLIYVKTNLTELTKLKNPFHSFGKDFFIFVQKNVQGNFRFLIKVF